MLHRILRLFPSAVRGRSDEYWSSVQDQIRDALDHLATQQEAVDNLATNHTCVRFVGLKDEDSLKTLCRMGTRAFGDRTVCRYYPTRRDYFEAVLSQSQATSSQSPYMLRYSKHGKLIGYSAVQAIRPDGWVQYTKGELSQFQLPREEHLWPLRERRCAQMRAQHFYLQAIYRVNDSSASPRALADLAFHLSAIMHTCSGTREICLAAEAISPGIGTMLDETWLPFKETRVSMDKYPIYTTSMELTETSLKRPADFRFWESIMRLMEKYRTCYELVPGAEPPRLES